MASVARAAPTPAKAPVAPARPPPAVARAPAAGIGAPIPAAVRGRLEASFGANLGGVRVHTGPGAAALAGDAGARAFAFGPRIVLGAGQQPNDLRLMAHEAAHVLQQQDVPTSQRWPLGGFPAVRLGPGGGTLQRWTPAGGDRFEGEAHRAADAAVRGERFTVAERTSAPTVQRLFGIDVDVAGRALNYFADKANLIPGFRMFTLVLGVNPVNMSPVSRTAANILRAVIELLPVGGAITRLLDEYGIIEDVGRWVDQQIATLGMVGGTIKKAITDYIGTIKPSDITDPGGVWDRAKRILTEPIDRIKAFAAGLVSGIVEFIKKAILMPLAKLAEKTRGWDLLTAVLGKNPITGDAVSRTAETLIPGFLKLIGQEEVWANMQEAKAIPRAWAWFQKALAGLLGFVNQLPTLAVAAFKSLELADIVLLPRAFAKVGAVFAGFLGDFITWAGSAVWNLLEIIFDSVSPGAFGYVKRTGAALKSILKNPLPFVGNLVKAAKSGFQNFATRFGTHLKGGLMDWLTGSLPGIYIPKSFDLREIAKFALSALGLTWANVRQKLVKATSEPAVQAMETGFKIVVALVRDGPAAAWEQIKEQLGNLKSMVIDGIIDFVVDTVVEKAIPKLIAMFIPGAGFISAILSIYDTVKVFIDRLAKIIQVVKGFIDSIVAIAAGNIGAAAAKVESILAGLLSLAISFLAGFAGLGKVADKLMGVLNKARAPIDKALDWLVGSVVKSAKKAGKIVLQAGVPEEPKERLKKGLAVAEKAVNAISGDIVPSSLLDPVLNAIRLRYGFRSLTAIDRGGDWWIKGVVNPPDQIKTKKSSRNKKPTPDGVHLIVVGVVKKQAELIRIETHAAAAEILALEVVQKAAQDAMNQKNKGKLGRTPDKPVKLDPQGGLLALSVASQKGMFEPGERNFIQIPGAATSVALLQTFSNTPSHTIVGPQGNAVRIGKYADHPTEQKNRKLTEVNFRIGMKILMAGQPLPPALAPHEGYLAHMIALMGGIEVARNPAQAASLEMALSQPASGSVVLATIMSDVGAIGANKQADFNSSVPGAVAPNRKPAVALVEKLVAMQLKQAENFIVGRILYRQLTIKSPEDLNRYIQKDYRGDIKDHLKRGFGLKN